MLSLPLDYYPNTMTAHKLARRSFLALAALPLSTSLRAQGKDPAALLGAGASAILIRHAQTQPGVGDPPGFRLDDCGTQRNLNEEGRAAAKRIGLWFQTRQLRPREVRSSAWCRCKETADLAFGKHSVFAPLNSFFDQARDGPRQNAELRAALARIPAGRFDVYITHQVNMTALTGEYPATGEGFFVDAAGKLVGRLFF